MTPERKLKAYAWDDEQEGTTTIEWFESAGKAKQYFASENELRFTEVRVYRVPWADNYRCMEAIPKELCWEHGWWWECNDCGNMICEDEGVIVNNVVYCHGCWKIRKNDEK